MSVGTAVWGGSVVSLGGAWAERGPGVELGQCQVMGVLTESMGGLLMQARSASGRLLSASKQWRWYRYFCPIVKFLMGFRS